ncbi:MerR family transcriptional regulator [Rhodobacteraceae bacterium 2376]|uniref:MerR family transcriptional regulator n=1 Tax=Rhabdonatronobacter sediminivivens TaxID=2743469 RepID=A0A7Z0L0C2_9RHOB|nr:MerR family transcriptional regulator [Rhabdonatronobacter sediminivivens]NYS25148.1 MerR family transcriptional regulator [Rhabdonatronobacter sediminivivens]
MRKAPEAFRTISEVAEILQTPAHVLRFWESKFSHVKPVKRAGGRRYYRPSDVLLLAGIRSLLHDQGMTIRGVQKMLSDKGTRHVTGMAPPAMVAQIGGETDAVELDASAIEGEVATDDARVPVSDTPMAADPPEDPAPAAPAAQEHPQPPEEPADTRAAETPEETAADPVVAAPDAPPSEAEDPAETAADAVANGRDPVHAPTGSDAARVDATSADDEVNEPEATDAEPEATARDGDSPAAPRLALRLRGMRPGQAAPHRPALVAASRRLDALLERMSETSGVRRW